VTGIIFTLGASVNVRRNSWKATLKTYNRLSGFVRVQEKQPHEVMEVVS